MECEILRKKTIEDYVELLYDIQKNKKKVHTNDIATALDINPASVTEIFQKLDEEGYINYKKYNGVTLTNKGKKIALKTKKRHEIITEFLVLIGVKEEIAEKDACEMEHILDPCTMESIIKFVEIEKNCEFTPFWLDRLKDYIKTGKLSNCPAELKKICAKYSEEKN